MWNGNETLDTLKREGANVRREARERAAQYLLAAFGLVAGLAWNEAIKALIEQLFPLAKNSLLAKFVYALIITFVVVFVSVYLVRIVKGKEEGSKN
ncbi:MAG: DUF5654 family protein [Candidatus Jorgensenbacteria bacterium]|nr:DUF5654 family protein [Candidatus Jorgensenbacteria bacterium]